MGLWGGRVNCRVAGRGSKLEWDSRGFLGREGEGFWRGSGGGGVPEWCLDRGELGR